MTFASVIGHDDIKAFLGNAVETGNVANAYLFTGEALCGRRTAAKAFATALLAKGCSEDRKKVIENAVEDGNHPDVIEITTDKAVLPVADIREKLVNTVSIRPYESPYKIYIVPDAEKMNAASQNALLKSIEEPPSYAVIILIAASPDSLLPTIRSRCIHVPFGPVADDLITDCVRQMFKRPDYEARAIAAYAQGNVGRALQLCRDEETPGLISETLELAARASRMDTASMLEEVRRLKEDKETSEKRLGILMLFFRDVLTLKKAPGADTVFVNEEDRARRTAETMSSRGILKILKVIDETAIRIRENVSFELAWEILLQTIRDPEGF